MTARDAAGEVKELVAALRAAGEPEADAHRRIYRPWGSYERIDLGPRFRVKRITVQARGAPVAAEAPPPAEHWIVVNGTAEVTVDDVVRLVHENEAAYLPIGCVHRSPTRARSRSN